MAGTGGAHSTFNEPFPVCPWCGRHARLVAVFPTYQEAAALVSGDWVSVRCLGEACGRMYETRARYESRKLDLQQTGVL